MSLDWIDVTDLSFNTLLLLERVQLSWFPGWPPAGELAVACAPTRRSNGTGAKVPLTTTVA